jgi:hypothetical protein
MGKKSGSAGQRSKKKHAKEVKRKNKPMTRPARQAPPVTTEARFGWRPAEEGIEGLADRVGIHYYQAATRVAEHVGGTSTLLPSAMITPAKRAALETPDLLARLAALGVVTDQDTFLAAIGTETSAVKLANQLWIPLLDASTTVHDRDFVRLAACELWQRFRPEIPSTEGLLDLFHLGFDHARKEEDARAVEIWLDFWAQLRRRLPPETRTVKAINDFFGERFVAFDDWLEVLLSATESAAESHPDLVQRTVTVVDEVRALLSEEGAEYQSMLVSDQAGLLFRTGRPGEGERVLRDLIAREPANVEAHLWLAMLLAPTGSEDRGELARALKLLEEAAVKRGQASDEWDLGMQITDMRERITELDDEATE